MGSDSYSGVGFVGGAPAPALVGCILRTHQKTRHGNNCILDIISPSFRVKTDLRLF